MRDYILFPEDAQKFVKKEVKNMTKQEMAEWLAEKVLGGTQSAGIWIFMLPHFKNQEGMRVSNQYLPALIYSPDGFFAVWDAVLAKKGYKGVLAAMKTALEVSVVPEYLFEAFYNAVFEAFKA